MCIQKQRNWCSFQHLNGEMHTNFIQVIKYSFQRGIALKLWKIAGKDRTHNNYYYFRFDFDLPSKISPSEKLPTELCYLFKTQMNYPEITVSTY